jgi:hypothetical protein
LGRQLGQSARDWVSANFSIATAVRKTEELYIALLAERRKRIRSPLA